MSGWKVVPDGAAAGDQRYEDTLEGELAQIRRDLQAAAQASTIQFASLRAQLRSFGRRIGMIAWAEWCTAAMLLVVLLKLLGRL